MGVGLAADVGAVSPTRCSGPGQWAAMGATRIDLRVTGAKIFFPFPFFHQDFWRFTRLL